MTELVLVLCGAVVKTAFKLWVGDNALADNLSADLTDMIRGQVSSALDRKKVLARFEKMEEIVADQILGTLQAEFRNLDEGEKNAAIIAVTETFNRAQLTEKVLFSGNLDPRFLENYVRKFTGKSTRDLSWGGTELYDRVLAQCCAYIIEIADKLPHFQAGAFAELLQRDIQILARLEDVLERLPAPSTNDTGSNRVETAYRQRIAKVFDRLELFGLDFAAQWYSLSIAYVNLKVSVGKSTEIRDAPFEYWLAEFPRLLIDGRAGSGKTTILQWIAVHAARHDFEGAAARLNGYVPFFLRLREHVGSALPTPEEFLNQTAPLLAPETGEWPRRQLMSGQALVLVNGIDEVPEAQRPTVLAWLHELTELFPDVRYVVTTRPGAIEEEALDDADFVRAALDPMEPGLIRIFIDQWHKAMREWQKDTESVEQLAACRVELMKTLDNDRFLSELANTPLLAGLICALNQHLSAQLPHRRGEIFEKALAMFYERDRKRGVVSDVILDLEATNHLLGGLALWMLRESAIEVTADRARNTLVVSSASLPNQPYDAVALHRHLLERSGLLREPTTGHVDFIHRTFQEYLAARALIKADHIGEIVKNASDDQWREVVILAAGRANISQTSALLRGLLRTRLGAKQPYQLRLLAVACLDEIQAADSRVLTDVEHTIPELLPPRNMDQAEALSHAGERLIPHLARVDKFRGVKQIPPVIRAAALIGGPNSFKLIADITHRYQYLIVDTSSARDALVDEFTRAWPYFDPDLYAMKVLNNIRLNNLRTDPRLLRGVAKISTVRSITLSGFVNDATDMSALDGTQISSLRIEDSDVRSLAGIIREWLFVKEVTLWGCRNLEDASSLRLLPNLEKIRIHDCPKALLPIGEYEIAYG